MKLTRIFSLLIATLGLVAFALPAEAQSRGNRNNNNSNRGNMHHGGDRGDRGHWRGHHRHGGPRVGIYFGGFGYPYYGYYRSPYYFGAPYYGYGYGYGSPVTPYYTYDPRGVYQGRVVNSRQATGNGSVKTRVQQQLAEGGYYRGEIDGIIGDGSRRAIRNYQRDNGLQVDGVIGDQLLSSMGLG